METPKKKSITKAKEPPLVILMAIGSLSLFMTLIISSSLPDLARFFNVSDVTIKGIISWCMLGNTMGVFFFAPISNQIGRKKTLYLGLFITILGSALSASTYFYKNYFLMNFGRVLQGFGSIAGFQIAMTLVGDCIKPPRTQVVSSWLIIAYALGWGICIALGSFLGTISWVYSFYFMIIYMIILWVLAKLFIEETLTVEKKLNFIQSLKSYIKVMKIPEIFSAGLLRGSVGSITHIFPAIAPFVVFNLLGSSKLVFGLWNFIPPLGLIAGCFLSMHFSKNNKPTKLFLSGLIIVSLAVASYYIIFHLGIVNLYSVFIPFLVCLLGLGFINTNSIAYSLEYTDDKAGCSSSFNFFAHGTAMLYMFLLPLIKIHSIYLIPVVFSFLFFIAWCVFALIKVLKKIRSTN